MIIERIYSAFSKDYVPPANIVAMRKGNDARGIIRRIKKPQTLGEAMSVRDTEWRKLLSVHAIDIEDVPNIKRDLISMNDDEWTILNVDRNDKVRIEPDCVSIGRFSNMLDTVSRIVYNGWYAVRDDEYDRRVPDAPISSYLHGTYEALSSAAWEVREYAYAIGYKGANEPKTSRYGVRSQQQEEAVASRINARITALHIYHDLMPISDNAVRSFISASFNETRFALRQKRMIPCLNQSDQSMRYEEGGYAYAMPLVVDILDMYATSRNNDDVTAVFFNIDKLPTMIVENVENEMYHRGVPIDADIEDVLRRMRYGLIYPY